MATYYTDITAGTDTNSGTNATVPKKTIAAGLGLFSGAGNTLYIKGSASYNERVTLPAGATTSGPNKMIGYTTTPGDGGLATIDHNRIGPSTATIIGNYNYWEFENIKIIGATSYGWSVAGDFMSCKNCHVFNAAASGFFFDNYATFVDCTAISCTQKGFDTDLNATFIRCVANSNTQQGFYLASGDAGLMLHCVARDNGLDAVYMFSPASMVHCTIEATTGNVGIFMGTLSYPWQVINCIVTGGTTSLMINTQQAPAYFANNCLYGYSSTSILVNTSNGWTLNQNNNVTGVDPDVQSDWSLGASSGAIGIGSDFSTNTSSGVDAGAVQTIPSTGSGTGTSRVILTS